MRWSSPGAYDISSLSTPLNALLSAGGITLRGSLRHLRHFRGRQLVEEVDAYDLLLHGIRGDLKNLENGDTLLVPPVGPQVSVDGMVRRPAVYELRGETTLSEALDLAGGVLPAAALRHIEVQRLEAHEKLTMLSVNLDESSDPPAVRRQLAALGVRDGDEVHVFPIAPYNTAAVYLQGHVLRPGRYAYTPGMRLADLVASYQDLLPEPAEHYAEIIRLREPDWRPVVESFDLAAALANPGPRLSWRHSIPFVSSAGMMWNQRRYSGCLGRCAPRVNIALRAKCICGTRFIRGGVAAGCSARFRATLPCPAGRVVQNLECESCAPPSTPTLWRMF